MKVRELIKELQRLDPNAEVHHSYNYGDRWHTQVAPKVRRVTEEMVRDSEYHSMPKVVGPDENEKDGDTLVVVLS